MKTITNVGMKWIQIKWHAVKKIIKYLPEKKWSITGINLAWYVKYKITQTKLSASVLKALSQTQQLKTSYEQ